MENIKQQLSYISILTSVSINLINLKTKGFDTSLTPSFFCLKCKKDCDYKNVHLYGSMQAKRWANKYIYYCPYGLIFTSNIYKPKESKDEYSIIAGPVIMGEKESIHKELDLPILSTKMVSALSENINTIITALTLDTNHELSKSTMQGELLDSLYTKSQKQTSYKELISYEKELKSYIISGNKNESASLINKILGEIYLATDYNLLNIKLRIAELIIVLSRGAIEGGADISLIFGLNDNYIETIMSFTEIDSLSYWLNDVIHQYIDCVFEFSKARHSDILYKVIAYLNTHFMEKITLDDVAKHVYLSRSYLSKIFKSETGESFSTYLNNLRVEKSKAYLKDNKLLLVEVAHLCGFDDQSYFTKIFKKKTGISPKKYRETPI